MRLLVPLLMLGTLALGCDSASAPPAPVAKTVPARLPPRLDPPETPPRTFLTTAAISPDGALVITGHEREPGKRRRFDDGPAAGSEGTGLPGVLCVWDVATGALRKAFDAHALHVLKIRFLPDGHQFLTGGFDGPGRIDRPRWRIWDLETRERLHEFTMELGVFREDLSRDGKLLVDQGPAAGNANIWDLRSGTLLRTTSALADASLGALFTPDARRIVFTGYDNKTSRPKLCLVNVDDGRLTGPFSGDFSPETFSIDAKRIAGVRHVPIPGTREWKYEVVVADAESNAIISVFGKWQDKPAFLAAVFRSDGRLLCGDTTAITLWDAESGRLLREIPIDPSTDEIYFSADRRFGLARDYGKPLRSGPRGDDSSVLRVYDLESGRAVRTWSAPWVQR